MFKFRFKCEDFLALTTGIGSNDVLKPSRTITRDLFPDAPDTSIDRPVPIIYGDVSEMQVAESAPIWVPNPTRGTYTQGGYWELGYGDQPSTATPPTSLNITETGGGSINLGDVPNDQFYGFVTAVDADGVESNPFPFLAANSTPLTLTGNGKSVVFTWSGATGAVKYRAYIGYFFYSVKFTQYIEVNHPTVTATFNANPPVGVIPNPGAVATGANVVPYAWQGYYAVSALVPTGETSLSIEAYAISWPFRRYIYLEWTSVPTATAYRVYKRNPGGDWLWRFDVGLVTTWTDDQTNDDAVIIDGAPAPHGLVEAIPIGTRTDLVGSPPWHGFLVAGHAVKEIVDLYQNNTKLDETNYGITFMVPGKTDFTTYFGANSYIDINGERFTLIYARGPQGDAAVSGDQPITLTVKGIEDVGDGSGTLLTNIFDQYLHFLRNWVLYDYQTGDWETSGPTWGDEPNDVEILDDTSFETAAEITTVRVGTGYLGAFVIGAQQQETVRTWIARLNQSADCYCGFSRKSQYVVKVLNDDPGLLEGSDGLKRFRAQLEIIGDSFKVRDQVSEMENEITTRYRRMWAPITETVAGEDGQITTTEVENPEDAEWESVLVLKDLDIQEALGEVKPYSLDLWAVRSPAMASDIGTRRLARRKYPYRTVSFDTTLEGTQVDLGDLILVSHPDGPSESGWVDQPCFVLRHELDPTGLFVHLEALDVGYLFDPSVTEYPESPYSTSWMLPDVLGYEAVNTSASLAVLWQTEVVHG